MLFEPSMEFDDHSLSPGGEPHLPATDMVDLRALLLELRSDRFAEFQPPEGPAVMPDGFDLDLAAREKDDGFLLFNNDPDETRVDDVIVTGTPPSGGGGYDPGWYDWDGYDTSQPEPPQWQDPRPYDACEDRRADSLADDINREIASQPDSGRREYSALIWRDDDGNLHRTRLVAGTNGSAPFPADPTELGIDSYSRVVGMVHSHPSEVNLGTDASPNWVPASHGWMHGGDWDVADDWVNNHRLSEANFTMYISYQGQVREYDYADNRSVSRQELTDRGSVQSGDYNPGQACS